MRISSNSEQTTIMCLWLFNDEKLYNKYIGLSAIEMATAFRDDAEASLLSGPLKEMLLNAFDKIDFDEVCASLYGYKYCTRCGKAWEGTDNCPCNGCKSKT